MERIDPRKPISLAEIGKFDNNEVSLAVEAAVRNACVDLSNRTNVSAARKITITIAVTPVVSDKGELLNAKFNVSIGTSMPPKNSSEISVRVKANGQPLWNPDSQESVDQETFLDSNPEPYRPN